MLNKFTKKCINFINNCRKEKKESKECFLSRYNSDYLRGVCTPKTVIDVGVGNGTFELYEAYPNANFILIEPVIEYEQVIAKIKRQYNCKAFYNAIGKEKGVLTFNVDLKDSEKSDYALYGLVAFSFFISILVFIRRKKIKEEIV